MSYQRREKSISVSNRFAFLTSYDLDQKAMIPHAKNTATRGTANSTFIIKNYGMSISGKRENIYLWKQMAYFRYGQNFNLLTPNPGLSISQLDCMD